MRSRSARRLAGSWSQHSAWSQGRGRTNIASGSVHGSRSLAPDLKVKLAANIKASGRYPPLILRPLANGAYQLLNGHQRTEVLRELGETAARCLVGDVSDEEALVLLATLNRLAGEDLPAKRAALIAELEVNTSLADLAQLLPEDAAGLQASLELLNLDVDALVSRLTEEADRTIASGPQLFSFAVDLSDAPLVEGALEAITATLSGSNRRGRALVTLARHYLSTSGEDTGLAGN